MKKLSLILLGSIPFLLSLVYIPRNATYGKTLILLVIVLFAMIAGIFGRKLKTEKISKVLPLFCGFYVLSNIVSLIFSFDPTASLLGIESRYMGFLPQLAAFSLFVLLIHFSPNLKNIYKILRLYLIPATIVLLFGIIQFFFNLPSFSKDIFEGRIDSLLGNPNSLALYILIHIPLLIYLWRVENKKILKKIIYPILFFLFTFVLVITGSRTGLGIFVLEVLAGGIYLSSVLGLKKKIILIVSLLVLLAAGLSLTDNAFRERYRLSQTSLTSLNTRLTIWEDTLPVILKQPLLGFGQDQFVNAFYQFSNSSLTKNPLIVDRAHNLLLDIAVEKGILGLGIFVILIFFIFYKTIKKISSLGDERRLLTISVLIALTSYLVFMQLNFTDIVNEAYFWMLLGLLYLSTQKS